jgi:predicted nucleotidyltransferase
MNIINNSILTNEQYLWVCEMLKGKNVVFASIHGSHLYGLNREGSDIDIKAVYAPTSHEMLMGESCKTMNKKNDNLEIEMEIKSLTSFIKSCSTCDTNCVDLLNTNDDKVLVTSPMWEDIKKHRSNLYAKNMRGLIGYIKTHTHKYGNKIERYDEIQALLNKMQEVGDKVSLKDSVIPEFVAGEGFKFIRNVMVKTDHEQHYIEVCGKKYITTWSSEILKEQLKKEVKRYGKRTEKGSGTGLDTKSLSHALRVLLQLKEILTDGAVTFPLKNSEYLLKVKLGEITDADKVMAKISKEYDICMELLDNSMLPDEVNIKPMLDSVSNYYFNKKQLN